MHEVLEKCWNRAERGGEGIKQKAASSRKSRMSLSDTGGWEKTPDLFIDALEPVVLCQAPLCFRSKAEHRLQSCYYLPK